jgi:hypothetical protein
MAAKRKAKRKVKAVKRKVARKAKVKAVKRKVAGKVVKRKVKRKARKAKAAVLTILGTGGMG